ncbi:NADH dehydrogenase [bacterium HR25]|jgi:nitroreductase|nr:NADH dehydrogenase [bacterium HR25]
MDAYRLIVSKRDSRQFAPDPVPEEALRRILQAGRMAGSSKNGQPCRFIVVREQEMKEAVARCGHYADWTPAAPLIVVIVVPTGGPRNDFDAGRAAQNMMLAAWAEGLASCPFVLHEAERARRVLGLPRGRRVAMAIAFGRPASAESLHRGQPRLPLEELVHYERW